MKETSQWDFSWSRKTFQVAHPTHTFTLYLQTEKNIGSHHSCVLVMSPSNKQGVQKLQHSKEAECWGWR